MFCIHTCFFCSYLFSLLQLKFWKGKTLSFHLCIPQTPCTVIGVYDRCPVIFCRVDRLKVSKQRNDEENSVFGEPAHRQDGLKRKGWKWDPYGSELRPVDRTVICAGSLWLSEAPLCLAICTTSSCPRFSWALSFAKPYFLPDWGLLWNSLTGKRETWLSEDCEAAVNLLFSIPTFGPFN